MSAGPHILLVDDDRNWVETLADYLRSKGYTVQAAHDGHSGLALLTQDHVALALIDQNMPDLDGLEVLQRLREFNRGVITLLVSGDDEPSLAARARAAGAQGFIPKTTPPPLLLRAVQQALAAANAPARATPSRPHLPVLRRASRTLPVPRPPADGRGV